MSTNSNSRGIDLTTLALTAVASGAAAYACSKVWAPGTLPSAAVTPVLVAVIKEALERPAEVVSKAVPVRGVVRGAGAASNAGDEPARRHPPPDEEPTRVAEGPISTYTTRRTPISHRWRLAIITGLLGFVLCVLVLTVPELVAGGSASGGGRQTTLFGGETKSKKRERRTSPPSGVTTPGRTVTLPPPTRTAPPPKTTTSPPTPTTPAPTPTTPAPSARPQP